MPHYEIRTGNCVDLLKQMPANSVHCCVTSPPYFGLRDYGVEGQIGLEPTPEQFVETMVAVFREVRRVLRDDGVLWLNLGDSYCSGTSTGRKPTTTSGDNVPASWSNRCQSQRIPATGGLKPKDLMLIPTTVAAALRDDGWYLRDAAIWHKPNPMPTSQQDRCTFAYEYMFQLTKSKRYYFDMERVREEATCDRARGTADHPCPDTNGNDGLGKRHPNGTRIPRNVWTIPTQGFKEAHFATFPEKLIELPIKSSTGEKGCCGCCGTPFKRIVEKVRRPTRPGADTKTEGVEGATKGNRDPQRHVTETVTTGWEAGCECGEMFGSVPCTVLDPFCGSGTTGVVALREKCQFIGLELNPEYVEIAHRRIQSSLPARAA